METETSDRPSDRRAGGDAYDRHVGRCEILRIPSAHLHHLIRRTLVKDEARQVL